jgi:hypothetical protein
MERNARVAWKAVERPWVIEKALLEQLSCPLNIRDNKRRPFQSQLRALRRAAKGQARQMPIAGESNQTRRDAKEKASVTRPLSDTFTATSTDDGPASPRISR